MSIKSISNELSQHRQNDENKIIDRIFSLPEVRESNRVIDSISKHQHGISIIMRKKAASKNDYYWFQVGYNNEIRFEPYFNFYVYKPDLTIKYLDPLENKLYTLAEWRKKEHITQKH